MIDGLIAGKLYGVPIQKTGANGKPYVLAKVRAAAGDGESLFVNVIAFDGDTQTALLALEDGDSVSLSGVLTPKVWTDKNGDTRPALDMVAHVVLTAYHVKRKRQAVQGDGGDKRDDGKQAAHANGKGCGVFDRPDDILS
ncbi:single-stranded DNA-binding protein [Ralstonia pseudosolanacearum]